VLRPLGRPSLFKAALSRALAGISFKTQALYVTVFVTRYMDLFLGSWVSFYNTIMKLFFIGSSVYILYLVRLKFKSVSFIYLSHLMLTKVPTVELRMTPI
jgi:hypothetical protein